MYRGRSITQAGGILNLNHKANTETPIFFYPLSNFERQMRSLIANELARIGSNINHEVERSVEVDNKGTIETEICDWKNDGLIGLCLLSEQKQVVGNSRVIPKHEV